jgi:archaellum biogenesis ATPase FlaH
MDAWIGAVKAQTLAVVAPRIGLRPGRLGSWGPCPACNEDARGKDDRRGPIGAAKDGKGWRCHRCQEGGDVLDLVAMVRAGRSTSQFTGAEWTELRQFCAEASWCNDAADRVPTYTVDKLMGGRARQATPAGPPARPAAAGHPGQGDASDGPAGATQGHDAGTGDRGPFTWRDGLAEECAEALWMEPWPPGACEVLEYLREQRRFDDDTIREWMLGVLMVGDVPWLTIPLRDQHERVVNVRFRSIPPAKKAYRVCPGRPLPLYGVDRLGTDTRASVTVTEGELDVVALWQFGVRGNVVSGTAGAATLKDEWLDVLEPYAGFTLCYDDDDAGNAGAAAFAEKMGQDRCSRAVLPKKDAGDCLAAGLPAEHVRRALDGARPMFGVELRSVESYGAELEQLIKNPQALVGRSTGSKRLDQCLGGLRPGVMVITGDTGHGKTTFATWLLWEQARAGVPVMLTSFEQQPIGTVQKLLRMQMGGDFSKRTEQERAAALHELGRLPLHVLHHYGALPADKLMQSVRYGARRYGVKAVLVDHLGFLLEPGDDERQQIEAVVRALAITAYTVGVTIVLICHPKALSHDADRPTLNDLKGASAIKQDASEVLVVVRDPPRPNAKPPRMWPGTWVYVDKVRSEFGVADSKALLPFGPLSCVYADDWQQVPEGRAGLLLAVP